jgi:Ni,Fe-hydrogenase III large subunit
VVFDVDPPRIRQMLERLDAAYRDVEQAVTLLWDTPSVMARFEDTGRVRADVARELGLVGLAARASGLRRDVRKTHPAGLFQFVHIPISTWGSGDVFARAFVRWLEIERSVEFVRTQLRELPGSPIRVKCRPPARTCTSARRGLAGEICTSP